MINKIFKKIQEDYRIKNKQLAEIAKIDVKIVSEFRSGKRNLGYKTLWVLILALGKIKESARIDLGLFIGGCSSLDGKIYWQKIIESRSDEELKPLTKIVLKIVDKQPQDKEDRSK